MKKFIIYINAIVFSSQCFSTEPTEFGYLDHIWKQVYYESLSMPKKYYYHEYKSSTYPFFSDVSPQWTDASAINQDNLTIQAHKDNYLGSSSNKIYTISKHGFITNCNQSDNYYRILVLKENDLVIKPTTKSSGIIWTDWDHIYQDSDDKAKWGNTDNNARYKQTGLDTYGNYKRLVFFNGSAHSDNAQGGYGGGAISIHHEADTARNITLESETVFVQNLSSRKYGGGAIQGREDLGGKIFINGKSWFINNKVIEKTSTGEDPEDEKASGGGAIRGRCKFSETSQVYFQGNTSIASANANDGFTIDTVLNKIGGGGGAICCAPNCCSGSNKSSDSVLIEILGDATFTGNEVTRFGGAIYVADGDIKLNPVEGRLVTFHDNYAASRTYRNAIDLSATSPSYSPKLEINPAGVVVFKDPITSVSTAKTSICPTATGRLDLYCDLFDPITNIHNNERYYSGESFWEGGRVNLYEKGWLRLTNSEAPANQITIPSSGVLGIFRQISGDSFYLSNLNSSILEINTQGSVSKETKISGPGIIRFLNNTSSFNFLNYSIDHDRNMIVENSTLNFTNDNSDITIRGSFQESSNSNITSENSGKFEIKQDVSIEDSEFTIKSNSIHFEKNFTATYNSEDNKAEDHKVINFQSNTITANGDFAINGLTLVLG